MDSFVLQILISYSRLIYITIIHLKRKMYIGHIIISGKFSSIRFSTKANKHARNLRNAPWLNTDIRFVNILEENFFL